MSKKVNKFLYRSPRILAILFMLFLTIFSADVLDTSNNFWSILAGLFFHNIPTLILLVITIIAWKYEIVGAIVFILFGLAYIVITTINGQLPWYTIISWSMIIAGPALLTGILFGISRFKNKIKN